MKEIVRIGNASGFWGDDPRALQRLLGGAAQLDYVTLDYLAEVTMSILKKQQAKDSRLGFARDFLDHIKPVIKQIKGKTVVITNAGGLNPKACAQALAVLGAEQGVSLSIALVSGDNVLEIIQDEKKRDNYIRAFDEKLNTAEILHKVSSAHAYLGAQGIAEALKSKPDVVITGRVIDAGLTLGPLIHEFSWTENEYDKLAHGICAGHLIECGAQVCGGNFTDFWKVKNFNDIGFPFVECSPNGSFVVTKQEGSGGLVSVETVKEQLLYEVTDPRAYVTPDVVADFSEVTLTNIGNDRVSVSGCKGAPPPAEYKVSACWSEGSRFSHALLISGSRLREKANIFSEILFSNYEKRCAELNITPATERLVELVGDKATDPDSNALEPREGLLRFSAWAEDASSLEILRKMIPTLVLSGPPGVTVIGGNPSPSEVLGFLPCLIKREAVTVQVDLLVNGEIQNSCSKVFLGENIEAPNLFGEILPNNCGATTTARDTNDFSFDPFAEPQILEKRAFARSGDKGSQANIAVFARSQKDFDYLTTELTEKKVKNLLPTFAPANVRRFVVPKLLAFNFVLEQALPGGGARNLRLDAQGKTLAQTLLSRTV